MASTLRELSSQISDGLEIVRKSIHALDLRQVELTSAFENLRGDVEDLLGVVRDGNGKPPLLIRINNAEIAVESLKVMIKDLETLLNTIERANSGVKIEDSRGRWLLISAVVSGIIGLVSSVLTFVLK